MRTIVLTLFSAVILSAASSGSTTEREVLAAMDAYRSAYLHGDAPAMAKLLSSDLTYVHSNGPSRNKEETVKSTATATPPQRIEFLPDTTVRIDGAMAFVAGREDLWEHGLLKHMYVTHVW